LVVEGVDWRRRRTSGEGCSAEARYQIETPHSHIQSVTGPLRLGLHRWLACEGAVNDLSGPVATRRRWVVRKQNWTSPAHVEGRNMPESASRRFCRLLMGAFAQSWGRCSLCLGRNARERAGGGGGSSASDRLCRHHRDGGTWP
jgi:hypothetical protein